jgi:hypothetical protein
MSEMQVFEDAQVAYEGYRDHTGGISLASGQAIPEWGALRPDIQAAWCASAHALREIMFCPPHWHMEHTAAMEPFAQCIACTREEVRELRQRRDFLFESNNRLVEERRAAEAIAERMRAALEKSVEFEETDEKASLGDFANAGEASALLIEFRLLREAAIGGSPNANR